MRFEVEPGIFGSFPGMRLAVAVADGLDNGAPNRGVEAMWRESWAEAEETVAGFGNAQSHPRVAAWREAMGSIGVPTRKFPSSIEAMLRRAGKGGEPFSINPLVDFYNAVSLRYVVPAGGFDLGEVDGPLELRLTREGDRFRPLGGDSVEAVEPGEVAYAFGDTVLTRHFVWRQSREALITDRTRSVFLVAEVLGGLDEGLPEAVMDEFRSGLAAHFGVEARTFVVHEGQPDIAL